MLYSFCHQFPVFVALLGHIVDSERVLGTEPRLTVDRGSYKKKVKTKENAAAGEEPL